MNTFDVNSSFMYLLAIVVITFVISQSIYFLVKAWRRGKELGIDTSTLRLVATSSGFFTIAPAVAILLGVITLSNALGLPIPWLRMSVLGSITYELPTAEFGGHYCRCFFGRDHYRCKNLFHRCVGNDPGNYSRINHYPYLH